MGRRGRGDKGDEGTKGRRAKGVKGTKGAKGTKGHIGGAINQSMFITLATTHRIFQASKAKNRATVLITKTELGTILTTEGP